MSVKRSLTAPILGESTALIVVDMQTGFLDPAEPAVVPAAWDIIPRINLAAAAVRGAGGLVAFTRHTVDDNAEKALPPWERAAIPADVAHRFRPDGPGHPLDPAIVVETDDLVVDKYRYSALAKRSSSLDADLRERGIDTIIVAGTLTNVCCESTARDGHSLDYRVLFLADATAAISAPAQQMSLDTIGAFFACVIDTTDLIGLLSASTSAP